MRFAAFIIVCLLLATPVAAQVLPPGVSIVGNTVFIPLSMKKQAEALGASSKAAAFGKTIVYVADKPSAKVRAVTPKKTAVRSIIKATKVAKVKAAKVPKDKKVKTEHWQKNLSVKVERLALPPIEPPKELEPDSSLLGIMRRAWEWYKSQ